MRGIVSPQVQYPAEPLKSENSQTPIPIPESLALYLSAHVARWRAETLLTNEWGQQLAPWTLERAFRGAKVTTPGLPATFRYHDLRHYFASLLIASAKTTLDTYSHLWPDSDLSTRAAVDAVMAARAEKSCVQTAYKPPT